MAKKVDTFAELLKSNTASREATQAEIRHRLNILPELQQYVRPLSAEEFAQLEKNILAEGCRDALIVWQHDQDYILIDGHNRYQICQTHDIDFKIALKQFDTIEQVKAWMLDNQLGKRNLNPEEIAYYRGLQYKLEKRRQGRTKKEDNLPPFSEGSKTYERLAEQHKVSSKTIQRDAKFAEGLDRLTQDAPELRWQILNRQLAVPKTLITALADKPAAEIQDLQARLLRGEVPNEANSSSKTKPTHLGSRDEIVQYLDKYLAQPSLRNWSLLHEVLDKIRPQ